MTVIPIVLPFSGSLESTSDCTVPPGDGDGVASVASAALQIARNMAAPNMPQILTMDFLCTRFPVLSCGDVSEGSSLCLRGAPWRQRLEPSLTLPFVASCVTGGSADMVDVGMMRSFFD